MLLTIFLGLLLFAGAVKQPTNDQTFIEIEGEIEHDSQMLTRKRSRNRGVEIHYKYSYPYVATIQAEPLVYDVKLWQKGGKFRMDALADTNQIILNEDESYALLPVLDHQTYCIVAGNEDLKGFQHLLRSSAITIPSTTEEWEKIGVTTYKRQKVNEYKMYLTPESWCTYYESKGGTPVFWELTEVDYTSGDTVIKQSVEFTYYKEGPIDDSVFEEPDHCKDSDKIIQSSSILQQKIDMAKQLIPLRPGAGEQFPGEANRDYMEFIKKFPRSFSSNDDYVQHEQIFLRNKQYIEKWNNANPEKHTLVVNKFADWTAEEFSYLRVGQILGPYAYLAGMEDSQEQATKRHVIPYEPVEQFDSLPQEWSWRGTPVAGIVKQQAFCGSCWTFAATSAMEGAWYLATNEEVILSEQQIVDCSWDYNVCGCLGGFVEEAMRYVVDKGGVYQNEDYYYIGLDSFCEIPNTKKIMFNGYGYAPQGNVSAVKEALYSKGTLAVSLAVKDDFFFYKSGVYTQPTCCKAGESCQTNHAVALVGYGIEDGQEYWLIKNSWGPYWGDEGYMKIAMEYDCGITLYPIYVLPDVEGTMNQQVKEASTAKQVLKKSKLQCFETGNYEAMYKQSIDSSISQAGL